MTDHARYRLEKMERNYRLLRSTEIALLALAAACGVLALLFIVNPGTGWLIGIPALVACVVFIARYRSVRLHTFDIHRLISYISRNYPVLEQSTDLLLREPDGLTTLERIQKNKIIRTFTAVYPSIALPHNLVRASVFFVAGATLAIVVLLFADMLPARFEPLNNDPVSIEKKTVNPRIPAAIRQIEINITPPKYTGKPTCDLRDPHLTLPEGSDIRWRITFSDTVEKPHLVFSGREAIPLQREGAAYSFQRSFMKSAFYQVGWTVPSGASLASDYFKIEIVPDKVPDIVVHKLPQFTSVTLADDLSIDLKTTVSDDYGIRDAYVIATVSKGSGESVKFREEKLPFTSPAKMHGRQVNAFRSIDLLRLGLEPGDELYFYVEALDNKTPVPGKARTETFFIALQDTASQQLSVEGGLGVDLMPEYFRSQRQIIIDSEKLLREKKSISKQTFNSRSNELGYDQKVLRLKYGEFLGEEFESAIGPGAEVPGEDGLTHDGEAEKDPKEKYGHVHDKDNEHNLVPDKKQPTDHHHKHAEETDPDKEENLADAYKHVHDDPEEATFFTQSIRAKLKAALTVMWDAELHLRMFDPEKSLPFQYTALRLLKEISNDSRIYVHKTGFDPPPLKEEKRLSGDLSEVKGSRHARRSGGTGIYPSIKAALRIVESKLQQQSPSLTASEKDTLRQAGNELAERALEEPGKFLKTLSQLKALTGDEVQKETVTGTLDDIRRAFWQALPRETMVPGATRETPHLLDRAFIKNLETFKNE